MVGLERSAEDSRKGVCAAATTVLFCLPQCHPALGASEELYSRLTATANGRGGAWQTCQCGIEAEGLFLLLHVLARGSCHHPTHMLPECPCLPHRGHRTSPQNHDFRSGFPDLPKGFSVASEMPGACAGH